MDRAPHVDWEALRLAFEAGLSYRALGKRYGLSTQTIHARAAKGGWQRSAAVTLAVDEAVQTQALTPRPKEPPGRRRPISATAEDAAAVGGVLEPVRTRQQLIEAAASEIVEVIHQQRDRWAALAERYARLAASDPEALTLALADVRSLEAEARFLRGLTDGERLVWGIQRQEETAAAAAAAEAAARATEEARQRGADPEAEARHQEAVRKVVERLTRLGQQGMMVIEGQAHEVTHHG